jgi:hypothetical protein
MGLWFFLNMSDLQAYTIGFVQFPCKIDVSGRASIYLSCRYVYTMVLTLIIVLLLRFNLQFFHFCIPLVTYSLRSSITCFKQQR